MEQTNFFDNFTSTASEVNLMKAGKNQSVKISRIQVTDSRHNFDGSDKPDLPEYLDATPQLAVVFVSTEGKGVITHRYNGKGFRKYSELSAKEIQSEKFVDCEDYACIKTKNGLVRILDEEKTEACANILSGLFGSLGLPVGSSMPELETAIEEGTVLAIDVEEGDYQGKAQLRVKRTRKAGEKTAVQQSLHNFTE